MVRATYDVVRYAGGARTVVDTVSVPAGPWQYADVQIAADAVIAASGYPQSSHAIDIPGYRSVAYWATEQVL
jgi:hypothetical protein